MKHEPIDSTGKEIKAGDIVRVIGVPNLSGMSTEGVNESKPVFEHLVGSYKKVRHFDEFGCAILTFSINKGVNRGWHSVAIEPFLLRIKREKKNDI